MEFVNTFWALVPPIVAIVLALITKETYSSLFIGILVGALFVSGFSPVGTLDAMITEGFTPAISDNAGIFVLSLYDLIESLAAAAESAALEAFKLFSCRVHVAVYLPAADELEAGGLVFDKAAHILGRIAEKQADLVRKIGIVSEPVYEAAQAAFGAAAFAVAALAQNILRSAVGKIAPQRLGAIEI